MTQPFQNERDSQLISETLYTENRSQSIQNKNAETRPRTSQQVHQGGGREPRAASSQIRVQEVEGDCQGDEKQDGEAMPGAVDELP